MITQEHSLESDISPEVGIPTQAEVDAKFDEIIGELEKPSPESEKVKDINMYKSVQRGEPKENNYKPW